MRIPKVNSGEWRSIAPLLPPNHGPGKPRLDDRLILSAFYYAEATRSSLECLPAAYGNPRSLRTRRQRWEADGTLARLMEVGKPVIERMKIGYLNLICGASLSGRQSTSEFFGHGAIPKLPHAQPKAAMRPGSARPRADHLGEHRAPPDDQGHLGDVTSQAPKMRPLPLPGEAA
jgi:transposase